MRQFCQVLTPTHMTVRIGKSFWPQAESIWPHAEFWMATWQIAPWSAKDLTLMGGETHLPPCPESSKCRVDFLLALRSLDWTAMTPPRLKCDYTKIELGERRKSMCPTVMYPFSSVRGGILPLTIMILRNESPSFVNGRFSCAALSGSSMFSADCT